MHTQDDDRPAGHSLRPFSTTHRYIRGTTVNALRRVGCVCGHHRRHHDVCGELRGTTCRKAHEERSSENDRMVNVTAEIVRRSISHGPNLRRRRGFASVLEDFPNRPQLGDEDDEPDITAAPQGESGENSSPAPVGRLVQAISQGPEERADQHLRRPSDPPGNRHPTKAGELFEAAVDAGMPIIWSSDCIDTADEDWPGLAPCMEPASKTRGSPANGSPLIGVRQEMLEPRVGVAAAKSTRIRRSGLARDRQVAERMAGELEAQLKTGKAVIPARFLREDFRSRYEAEVVPGLAA